ncbi:hypothetical protein JCM10213_005486 [Rhodosporidiobolus nylandii]
MSSSLPATPFLENGKKPFLSLDLGKHGHASFHDSPAGTPTLAPSPIPHNFGGPRAEADDAETGSFVDRGSLVDHERDDGQQTAPFEGDRAQVLSTTARMFAQLEAIKSIQAGIAGQHAALEGISPLSSSSGTAGEKRDGGDGAHEEPKDGGLGAKSKEEKERIGKTYQTTADEFAKREKGVDEIMAKLSELSAALKAFHALPSPCLFPQSSASPSPTAHSPPPARARIPPSFDPPTKAGTEPAPEPITPEQWEARKRLPHERGYTEA